MRDAIDQPIFADAVQGDPDHRASLSVLQQILLTTDGTVTNILQAYAGEPVSLVKLSQSVVTTEVQDPRAGLAAGEKAIERKVLLRGSNSGTNLLYAESLIIPDRLHPRLRDGLLSTDEPIGRLISVNRVETFRDFVSWKPEPAGECAGHFGIDPDATMISRCYRIVSQRQPIMVITEKFPATSFLSC